MSKISHFWIAVLSIAYFSVACSQLTGTWLLDWQNYNTQMRYNFHGGLFPFLTVSEESDGGYTLLYPLMGDNSTLEVPSFDVSSTNDTISLVFGTESLVYNTTSDTVIYTTNSMMPDALQLTVGLGQTGSSYQFLYSRNGTYFSQTETFGLINGNWTYSETLSPGPISCCIPQNVFLFPDGTDTLQSVFYYDTTECSFSTIVTTLLVISSASTKAVHWTDVITDIYYNPNEPDQLTISTGICTLQYQKSQSQESNLLSGTWQLDWQVSQNVTSLFPSSYQISTVNGSYMVSTYLDSDNVSSTQAFAEYNGLYIDAGGKWFEKFYSYDLNTNSLMTTYPFVVIYSPNGSLFSSEPFIANETFWTTDSASIQGSCCVPEGIQIRSANASNTLNAYYYLSAESISQPQCASLEEQNGPTIETLLQISTPSIVQLNWTDTYGSSIFFANASTTSVITVQNFMNTGCSFNVEL